MTLSEYLVEAVAKRKAGKYAGEGIYLGEFIENVRSKILDSGFIEYPDFETAQFHRDNRLTFSVDNNGDAPAIYLFVSQGERYKLSFSKGGLKLEDVARIHNFKVFERPEDSLKYLNHTIKKMNL